MESVNVVKEKIKLVVKIVIEENLHGDIKMIKFIEEVKDIMAMIYATLIIKGKKTLEQVPSIIRSEVEELLEVLLED